MLSLDGTNLSLICFGCLDIRHRYKSVMLVDTFSKISHTCRPCYDKIHYCIKRNWYIQGSPSVSGSSLSHVFLGILLVNALRNFLPRVLALLLKLRVLNNFLV